jgi:hypothetical protein
MRLTARDAKVLTTGAAARWVTTAQMHAMCFPEVSIEVARRRLRLLRKDGYLFSYRASRMAETLHSLGPRGKEALIKRGWQSAIRLERKPPKNLEHFLGINDIRVAVERSARREGIKVEFFFAYWELLQRGWALPLIPDAVCQFARDGKELTVLFEYDRGEESPGYLIRTKFKPYGRGLDGFPFSKVVVVIETRQRLGQLREYAVRHVDVSKFIFLLQEELAAGWSPADLLQETCCVACCVETTVSTR